MTPMLDVETVGAVKSPWNDAHVRDTKEKAMRYTVSYCAWLHEARVWAARVYAAALECDPPYGQPRPNAVKQLAELRANPVQPWPSPAAPVLAGPGGISREADHHKVEALRHALERWKPELADIYTSAIPNILEAARAVDQMAETAEVALRYARGQGYLVAVSPCRDKGRACTHDEDIEYLVRMMPSDWEVVWASGRDRYVIMYDPALYRVEYLSANEAGSLIPGLWVRVPTSAHGCWKVRKNQELVLIKK